MTKVKLGPKASSFWDPTQPVDSNKSLSVGEVKDLHPSPTVSTWLRNGGLVLADPADVEAADKASKANAATAAASGTEAVTSKKAQELLNAAKQKHKEADIALEEAGKQAAENTGRAGELDEREAKLDEREKALLEKEKGAGENTGGK